MLRPARIARIAGAILVLVRVPGLVLAATAAHGTTMPAGAPMLALLHLPAAGHGVAAEAGRVPTPVAADITGVVVPVAAVRRLQAVVAVIPVGAAAAVTVVEAAVVEAIPAAAAEA